MTAIAAVDMALWDIRGKAANVPVYQLLGGASREAVMVYGHANGKDIEDTVAAVGAVRSSMGYKAIRAQSAFPASPGPTAWQGRDALRAGGAGPAARERLEHRRVPRASCPSSSRALRKEFGPDLHLLHDVHHRLTPIEAGRLGKALEPYHLFWMEDAVPAELQEGFRLIRQHTTTPLAVGEVFNTIYDCQPLIQEQLIDYIRMTVVHAGGLTHLRKIANLAELYHVRTGCHGATDLSPVCMAAALHFDLAVHNFGIQEYMRHSRRDRPRVPARLSLRGRHACIPGDAPGLGVDIDETPGREASLPARLPAGEPQARRHAAQLVTPGGKTVAYRVGSDGQGRWSCGRHVRHRARAITARPRGGGRRRRAHVAARASRWRRRRTRWRPGPERALRVHVRRHGPALARRRPGRGARRSSGAWTSS